MEMCEYNADAIVEELSYQRKGFNYITEEQYYILRILYKKANKEICDLSNRIFDLGTVDLYGMLINYSQSTLEELQKIIDIIETSKVQLPDINFFKKFKFFENGGWGNAFTKEEIFRNWYHFLSNNQDVNKIKVLVAICCLWLRSCNSYLAILQLW